MFECEHKFGRIRVSGYQHCRKCNLATMPLVQQRSAPCYHYWEHSSDVMCGDKRVNEVLVCKLCGDKKAVNW